MHSEIHLPFQEREAHPIRMGLFWHIAVSLQGCPVGLRMARNRITSQRMLVDAVPGNALSYEVSQGSSGFSKFRTAGGWFQILPPLPVSR